MHRFAVLYILLMLALFSNAQTFYAENFTVKDGLPNNAVRCIFKDKDGFLWIGTDAGAAKFNGKDFETFTYADGLAGDEVWSITQDKNGAMWFACYNGGISKLHNGKITNYNTEDILPNKNVRKIYYSKKFDCILAGADNGLAVFYKDTVVKFSGNPKVYSEHMQVMDFLEKKDFILVYTYAGNKTYQYFPESKTLQLADTSDRLTQKKTVSAVFVSLKGDTILSYAREGIQVFKKNTSVIYRNIGQVFDYCEDNEGNIWFASWAYVDMKEPGGIYKYDGKNCINSGEKFGIKDRLFFSIYYNKEDNTLWAGSVESGLFMFPEKIFSHFYLPEENTKITDIFIDKEDKIWAACEKGIYIFKNNDTVKYVNDVFFYRYRKFFTKKNISNLNRVNNKLIIFPFFKDFDDNVWAGTNFGLFSFDIKGNLLNYYPASSDRRTHFYFLDKTFLIASGWDIYYTFTVEKNKIRRNFYSYNDNAADASAVCDINGKIWISSDIGGLCLVKKDGHTVNFNKENSPLETNVLSYICGDAYGNIITASKNDNLYIFKYYKDSLRLIKKFNNENGIIGKTIEWLACNRKNELFISTNLGINVVNLDTLYKNNKIYIRFFDDSEGLGGSDNTSPVFDSKGNLYFASGNKIVKFTLPEKNPEKKKIFLARFLLNFSDTSWNDISTENMVKNFKHNENNFEFYFDIINFVNHDKDLFAYKLVGYNDRFTNFSKERKVAYMDLSPGDYKLKVISFNIGTGKKTDVFTLRFKVLKPWYNTLLFYAVLIFTVIALLWLFMHLKFKKIEKEKLKAIEINKRIAETEMKALQSQMNPHFVFNAVTAIQNFILGKNTEKADRYLGYFAKLLRLTFNNASEKLISLNEEINYLKYYVSIEKMRFTDTFKVDFEADKSLNLKKTLIPPMLLQPLIENAIKHGNVHKKKNGFIKIEIKIITGKILFCSVSDNGSGIQYKTDKRKKNVHSSHGIQIIKDRIKLLNTTFEKNKYYFEISSGKNKEGTRINLYLPLIINPDYSPKSEN